MQRRSIAVVFFIMMGIFQAEADMDGQLSDNSMTCLSLSGNSIHECYCSSSQPEAPYDRAIGRLRDESLKPVGLSRSVTRGEVSSLPGNTSNVVISEPANCNRGRDPLGICAFHSQGFFGNNISVAIIDYEYYMNRLSLRELPAKRIELFNGTYSEYHCHGTACAEVIGDLAPNVTLYMVGIEESSRKGFIDAVEKLNRLGERIDIISSSIDFSFGLFDEGDEICRAVSNFTRNGTIWINAAGDSARKHWLGPFRDRNENGFNEFGPGAESLNLTAKRRELIAVYLSWNESWSQADQDYDLYLYSPDGSYAISNIPQEGYEGQDPAELVTMIAPVSGEYSIQIRRYSATDENITFQLFSSHNLSNYNVSASSIGALASCPEVITVGAVDAQTLQLEDYSSMGPTLDGRMKPELVAPDNITVSSYMPEMFKGSSASAPFAAGIFALALEKGRKIGMKDEDVVALLFDSAIDLGPEGPENGYGYGLVNLKRFAEL